MFHNQYKRSLHNQYKRSLNNATSYSEWRHAAAAHDDWSGMVQWKAEESSSLYDNEAIRERYDKLVKLRETDDAEGLLFMLNEGIHGNVGSMGNPALYRKAAIGTKDLVHHYINEIVEALQYIAALDDQRISFEERLDFFRRASHCYGRPALMLSGAGSLGNFHAGVISALLEQGLLPSCISGSSAGAIMAAILGCHQTEEIAAIINLNREDSRLIEAILIAENEANKQEGRLRVPSTKELENIVSHVIPDMTFAEAYELTGRFINISVAPAEKHQTSRLLNATTSPNILVRSAVLASCSVPGIYPARTLLCKNAKGEIVEYLSQRKWIDGSITDDLPAKRLSRLYGVNYFIVSQANPLAVPFISDPKGDMGLINTLYRFGNSAVKGLIDMNYQLVHRYIPNEKVERLLGIFQSLATQNYTGDVTFKPKLQLHHYLNALSALSTDEARQLFNLGEKSVWPKIEMIRNCTVVADTLLQISSDYEARVMSKSGACATPAASES